jgi:hypothetical protein
MNLPFAASSSSSQRFFAIHLAESRVESALWEVVDGQLNVISQSELHDWSDEESCIAATDESLQELGPESEDVQQTLFALDHDWVDAKGIVAAHKHLFQRMTKELTLKPVGFVVTVEALTQYLGQTLTPHLQAVLIEVGKQFLTVSLVKQAQIVKTERVGRSGQIVSDLAEALAHFQTDTFPPKFFLFSAHLTGPELSEERQALLQHDWVKAYQFQHPPVIELYDPQLLLNAVIQSGGQAVVSAPGTHLKLESAPPETAVHQPVALTPSEDLANVTPAELPLPTDTNQATQPAATLPAMAGKLQLPALKLSGKSLALPTAFQHPKGKVLLPILAGVLGGVVILLVVGFITLQRQATAVIGLQLATKTISKDVTLTLDPSVPASDPTRNLLKADLVNKEVSGTLNSTTTGTKIIGDKATGKITLYNRTSSPKTFNAGTTVGSGNLKFTLDSTVTVASASTGAEFETKPGTQDVAVTAAQIGTESNIAKDTDLTVESYAKDTYVARTVQAFTGGSSRETQAVSKEDRDLLATTLKKKLIDQAVQELKTQTGAGKFTVPTGRVKVLAQTYSAEVGKETDTLNLTLKLQVETLAYQLADLKPLATSVLSSDVPSGFELTNQEPQILSSPNSPVSTASAKTTLQTSLSAIAQPKVDLEAWKKELAGKSQTVAENILKSKTEIKSYQFALLPRLYAAIFHKVPKDLKKIELSTEEAK